jgi:hypothetical protein
MRHGVLEQADVVKAVRDAALQLLELVPQPHDASLGQLGSMALDDAVRLCGVTLVD